MDERFKTLRHIETVRNHLDLCIRELLARCEQHDQTKLQSPEREAFDEFTEKLRGSTYGSPEYKQFLDDLKAPLAHHYANNRHHPEYFTGTVCDQCGNDDVNPCTCGGPRHSIAGVRGMNLIDILEMVCDWRSSSMRHADGNIFVSLPINQKRFGYSDDLAQIIENTMKWIAGEIVYHHADES